MRTLYKMQRWLVATISILMLSGVGGYACLKYWRSHTRLRTVSFRLVSEGSEEPMRHRAFMLCNDVKVTHIMLPQCAGPLGRMETDEEGRFVLDLRNYPTTRSS